MTQIKPFRAILYNRDKVKDMAKVVCPPYDVISTKQQEAFHNSHPANFIRVELGKEKASDDRTDNKYIRAKKTLDEWLKEGYMQEDDQPSIYFYKQEYRMVGQKHSRLGFIASMKVQDEKDSKIFPHENTHAHAKEDRIKLLRAVKANLSSIFVCFSDQEKKVETIFQKYVSATKPLFDLTDDDGVRHIVWRLSDPVQLQVIVDALAEQPLFIADGHHRYEVAKEYRKTKLAKIEKPTGEEPFQYVMTYFTNIDSKDLKIFPMHRIITKLGGSMDFVEEFFRVDKLKSKEDLAVLLAKAGQNEHAFGLYTKQGIKLLRLKNKLLIDKFVTEGSRDYRRLDATILKYFVLDRVGVKSESIIYTKDINETFSMVDAKKAEASFIMNPVKIEQLKAIALNGERMPPKTTYFYPKVLSGLTVHRVE
jgi:uncharacterized protein (DUF1015 family)